MLEEVRAWGEQNTLGAALEDYLSAGGPVELFEKVLARYQKEYEIASYPDFVGNSMRLLWASRGGLREAELLDLLGKEGQPLPAAYWCPLVNVADRALIVRSGRIGFAHTYFRQAVENRFVRTVEEQHHTRLHLADYFGSQQPAPQDNARLATRAAMGTQWSARLLGKEDFLDRHTEEYPWQLEQAGQWERLAEWLSKLPDALFAYLRARADYQRYWVAVEKNSSIRATESFRDVIEHPEKHPNGIALVAAILQTLGNQPAVAALAEHVVRNWEPDGRPEYESALMQYVNMLSSRGEFNQARQVCSNAKSAFGSQRLRSQYARVLMLESELCQKQQQLEVAWDLAGQAYKTFKEIGETADARAALLEQATVLMAKGDLQQALSLLETIAQSARPDDDHLSLLLVLPYMGNILEKLGRAKEAETPYAEAEQIIQALDEPDLSGAIYFNRATSYHEKHQNKEALEWYKKGEKLAKDAGSLPILFQCWNSISILLLEEGDSAGALSHAEEAERFFRKNSQLDMLEASLSSKAMILWQMGSNEDADAAFKAAESAARQSGSPEAIVRALANQALFVLQQNKPLEDLLNLLGQVQDLLHAHGLATRREQLAKIAVVVADRFGMKLLQDLAEDETEAVASASRLREFCEQWQLPEVEAYIFAGDAFLASRRSQPGETLRLIDQASKLLPAAIGEDDPHFLLRRVLIFLTDRLELPNKENPLDPANEQCYQRKESVLRALGAKEELVRCLCAKCLLYVMVLRMMPLELTQEARAAMAAGGQPIGPQVTMRQVRMGWLHEAIRIADEAGRIAFTHSLEKEKDSVRQCYVFLAETADRLVEPLVDAERLEEARELADVGSRAAKKTDNHLLISRALTNYAMLLDLTGEHETALLMAREAAERARAAGRSDLDEALRPLLGD